MNVLAPWTREQVDALNRWQELAAAGLVHPVTCEREDCRSELVAHEDGWRCPAAECDYRNIIADPAMVDQSKHPEMPNWLKVVQPKFADLR